VYKLGRRDVCSRPPQNLRASESVCDGALSVRHQPQLGFDALKGNAETRTLDDLQAGGRFRAGAFQGRRSAAILSIQDRYCIP